ncbi:transposable element Tc3 transposase [Trichonephila clavipes]|nr:transposable element Tc3 transposase [Trichonephila clavipes]
MSSRHHIDDFMRGRIIGKIEEGRKITDVAREFDIAHSVVSRLWKSFKTTGMCSRRHGGRRVRNESRFSLSSDCRRQLIWRESGTAYRPENIQEKVRYPTCSIMVWAGIMINGRTRLHVVANGTMTDQRYIDEVLLPNVRLFRGAVGDKFVFMDDNATYLNPIENVWDALGRQVTGRNYPPTNKNTLIRALTEQWDKLPQQLLNNVVQIGNVNLIHLLITRFHRRTADVRSVGYSELFSLSREDILAAMKDYPEAQDILQTMGRKRLMEARLAANTGSRSGPNEPNLPSSSQVPAEGERTEPTKPRSTVSKIKEDVRSLRKRLKTRSATAGTTNDSGETIEMTPIVNDTEGSEETSENQPAPRKRNVSFKTLIQKIQFKRDDSTASIKTEWPVRKTSIPWYTLDAEPQTSRRQLCDEIRMWAAEWNEIVFTDESRICLQHHDGQIRVWRHRGERMLNNCVMHRHTGPAMGIMVWNGIGYHSRTPTPSPSTTSPSDEAHFWLNGYVNKQNCRIWSEANPQVYVETPLHPEKLTVWCTLWAGEILLQKR